MPSDQRNAASGPPAVVYVGTAATGAGEGGTGDRLVAEAHRRALDLGLSPLKRVARTASEADALLAAHPDAVIVAHPGDEPLSARPEAGGALWNFLHIGAVLRPCTPGGEDGSEPAASPPVRGREAFLVVELTGQVGPGSDRLRVREAECRAFAEALGLRVMDVLMGDRVARAGGRAAVVGLYREQLTVIVHPDVTVPRSDAPDALLMRWLRQGRVIHSGRWVNGFSRGQADAVVHHLRAVRRHQDTVGAAAPASDGPHIDFTVREEMALGLGDLYAADSGWAGVVSGVVQAGSHNSVTWGGGRANPPRPPRDTSRPLPHDGLYIRRNNAFGTRSALGAKDLIEQGVIIGQDQIRFDDFVAARTDQVPGPRPGEAVGVSHGLAAVHGEFKANEATTHFVEITLKAGETAPEDAPVAEPLPVNFVFVVDTSYSMRGQKLDTVKSALQTLYDTLRPADCLGIITFDHSVRTVLPAAAKKDLSADRFAEVVSGLTADGGTDINLGVQYGIDEIGRHAQSGRTLNCLYVFSDGDPTSGERDWIRIRANIAAKLRGDLTLSCFGFGSDARMPELAALAGLAGGHSTFVTRPEQVGTDLLGDLARRDHLAAIDIQLKLDIDPEVEIRHLYGHDLVTDLRARAAVLREAEQAGVRARTDYGTEALPDIITEEKGIRIFAPDLAFGETYWVVLEVRVPPGRDPEGLGTATVQYVDTVARASRRHEIDLSKAPTLAEEIVTVHAIGLWTSEVTFYALDDLYDRDREAAKNRLTQHIEILKAAHSRLPADEFRDDQVTLQKLITLAGTLGTMVSFSDASHGPHFATTVRAMNDFGRVRSGFWQQY
ncbi:VWA domain-containing protein [Streptomyces sp. NPDC003753]